MSKTRTVLPALAKRRLGSAKRELVSVCHAHSFYFASTPLRVAKATTSVRGSKEAKYRECRLSASNGCVCKRRTGANWLELDSSHRAARPRSDRSTSMVWASQDKVAACSVVARQGCFFGLPVGMGRSMSRIAHRQRGYGDGGLGPTTHPHPTRGFRDCQACGDAQPTQTASIEPPASCDCFLVWWTG